MPAIARANHPSIHKRISRSEKTKEKLWQSSSGSLASRQLPQREDEEDNKVKIKAALQKMHEEYPTL
ncbi:unnamed protein product [Linum tenue]|uniref:Uncharacterized protein n=1 Tax=Linum tenue TaxID=586396 RepID=A0AAV0NV43_9ROSI|nr:unnamed protein product [Linum tenue]